MSHDENFESHKAANSIQDGNLSSLSAYAMERPSATQSARDLHHGLVEKGIVPPIFLDMSPEVRTGTPATREEIKDSGVKAHHGNDGSTTSEYPTGVKIESPPPPHSDKSKLKLESEPPNHRNKKGEVIDPKGRVLARTNEDGSVTVDSGNGFFTHYPDGTVRRESALRSHDGKTFEVLDTNTPLGNLRPSDMTAHHK
jgi:hypothetical protein